MGRSTKLDDLVEKRVLDALKAGHSYAAAAKAAGIDEWTLHHWRRLGREGDERYSQFSQRVDRADQEAEDRCVQVLKSALEGEDMKLAVDTAWKWLARRRPQDWAEKKHEAEPPMTDEQADAILAEAVDFAKRTA